MGLVSKVVNKSDNEKYTVSTIKKETTVPIVADTGEYKLKLGDSTSKYQAAVYSGWSLHLFRKPLAIVLYSKYSDVTMEEFHRLLEKALTDGNFKEGILDAIETAIEGKNYSVNHIKLKQLFYGFREVDFLDVQKRDEYIAQ